MSTSHLLPWATVALVSYVVYQYASSLQMRRKLPPGPKPLPFVGNVRDFPPPGVPEHLHWLKHKDLYGPVSSVTVFGKTMVIIHDRRAAHDLLEQTASKTSGRATMIFGNELCGYGSLVLNQGYDSTFRHYRKLMHRALGTKVTAARFEDSQGAEMERCLVRTLNEPDKWLEHLKTMAGASVLKMAYGYTVEPHQPDPLVDLSDRMMHEFSVALVPMAWAVDMVPALRYLPDGFPGATFKKTARKFRTSIESVAHIPYRFVQRQMATGAYQESYVSRLIQQYAQDDATSLSSSDETAIMWTAASLYGAGADTTIMTLKAFTLAMILSPDVQRKAQAEIDRVVGQDRLPGFEDREQLPYIGAMVKEALRWWPVAPFAFPHTATEDVQYEGLHIPKGALLLPAVWWFLHDPEVYADPDAFDPERYLAPRNEPDPATEGFGYGRRICPGRFFAESSLYLNIVQSLAVFNMKKAVDGNGDEIDVEVKPKPGVLSDLTDFQYRIEPRSVKHADLVRRLEREGLFEEGNGSLLEEVPI